MSSSKYLEKYNNKDVNFHIKNLKKILIDDYFLIKNEYVDLPELPKLDKEIDVRDVINSDGRSFLGVESILSATTEFVDGVISGLHLSQEDVEKFDELKELIESIEVDPEYISQYSFGDSIVKPFTLEEECYKFYEIINGELSPYKIIQDKTTSSSVSLTTVHDIMDVYNSTNALLILKSQGYDIKDLYNKETYEYSKFLTNYIKLCSTVPNEDREQYGLGLLFTNIKATDMYNAIHNYDYDNINIGKPQLIIYNTYDTSNVKFIQLEQDIILDKRILADYIYPIELDAIYKNKVTNESKMQPTNEPDMELTYKDYDKVTTEVYNIYEKIKSNDVDHDY